MGIELLASLIAASLGAIFPLTKNIIKSYLEISIKEGRKTKFNDYVAKLFDIEVEEHKTYKVRLEETLTVLKSAFAEVDKATIEFTELMKEKEKSIDILEKRLSDLSNEEITLKSKVETLQKVPIEALTHFEEILSKGDKRSAFRDYLLFFSGIIASVIVTLVLKLLFNI